MKKRTEIVVVMLAIFVGSFFGQMTYYAIYPPKKHLCTCELCKSIRQLEACEVIDSIVKERIVININRDNDDVSRTERSK